MPSKMRDLRLRPYHEVSGAVFRPEADWQVPANYGGLASEVLAVRSGAGIVDLSDRAKVCVRGADRTSFLDGLITADVKVLEPGASAYALVLTDKSRVVGDLRVYAFENHYVLDIERRQAGPLLAYIQKFLISDDVVLEDLSSSGHLEVHGPDAARIVSATAGVDVRGLLPDHVASFAVEKRRVGHVARVGGVGEPGFALWAEGADLAAGWSRFLRRGIAPVGRDAFDVLRIEAGVPRVGADMGEDTLALEVAPARAINFSKGCYVGQEVVARGTYRGHMNRRLMGLQVDGDVPPERGNRVRTAHGDVGHVSSGTWSPSLGRVIALALLRIEEVGPSTELSIDRGGWDLRAALHPLPFVRARG